MGHIGTALTPNRVGAPVPASPTADRGRHRRGAAARRRGGGIDTLSACFPVARRLIGDESFHPVAQRFLGLAPRGLGVPWQGFPHFLRHQGQGASFDYVADIAELECARAGARIAAAARPISAQALASMVSIRLDRLRVTLHPSVHLVTSRFPIVTIWNNNQRDGGGMIERWVGESALVARPFRAVEVGLLPAGGHAFMAALAEGQTVAAAVMVASAMAPTFDTDVGLAVLMSSHIVVGLCHDRQADPTIAITQCGTRV